MPLLAWPAAGSAASATATGPRRRMAAMNAALRVMSSGSWNLRSRRETSGGAWRSPRRCSAPLIGDAVDGPGKIVRNQDRAVRKLGDIDRAPQIFAGPLDQPAFGEGLRLLHCPVLIGGGEQDARANRRGAVPGPVLGGEE